MKVKIFIAALLANTSFSVGAFDPQAIDRVICDWVADIENHYGDDCESDVSKYDFISISYANSSSHESKNKLIEVVISTSICAVEDNYFVRIQEEKGRYHVIDYAAYSQPE